MSDNTSEIDIKNLHGDITMLKLTNIKLLQKINEITNTVDNIESKLIRKLDLFDTKLDFIIDNDPDEIEYESDNDKKFYELIINLLKKGNMVYVMYEFLEEILKKYNMKNFSEIEKQKFINDELRKKLSKFIMQKFNNKKKIIDDTSFNLIKKIYSCSGTCDNIYELLNKYVMLCYMNSFNINKLNTYINEGEFEWN